MTDPTTDELANQLAALRRKMVAAATDETTPEQRAQWKTADEAMARRIHKARPRVPEQHALATLETLRAIQRYEASATAATPAEPMPDEQADARLAPLKAKARALHAQKDAEHRAAVLQEAATAIQDVIDRDRARFPARSNDRAALGAARQIVLDLIGGPGQSPAYARLQAAAAKANAEAARHAMHGLKRVYQLCREHDTRTGLIRAHEVLNALGLDENAQIVQSVDEEQAEAHPPTSTWKIETHRRGEWLHTGATYDDHAWGLERYQDAIETDPDRAFRLVRGTITYTVEAEHQPGEED